MHPHVKSGIICSISCMKGRRNSATAHKYKRSLSGQGKGTCGRSYNQGVKCCLSLTSCWNRFQLLKLK